MNIGRILHFSVLGVAAAYLGDGSTPADSVTLEIT